jgi:hypothetical protein
MILGGIFERFAEQSPVTVMARAALEHALSPRAIDALFEAVAERQYTRKLLFSTVVDLMGTIYCKPPLWTLMGSVTCFLKRLYVVGGLSTKTTVILVTL